MANVPKRIEKSQRKIILEVEISISFPNPDMQLLREANEHHILQLVVFVYSPKKQPNRNNQMHHNKLYCKRLKHYNFLHLYTSCTRRNIS